MLNYFHRTHVKYNKIMKHIKLTLLFTVFMSMVVIASQAHDIEVPNSDGVIIYYNYTNNNTELSVTYEGNTFYDENNYSGSIVIPESVIYNGNTYMVTDIDINAFTACNNLTAITIPKSIKKIYDHSFTGCSWSVFRDL